MTARNVVVVATGTANVASIMAGLRRAGANPTLSADADDVRNAPRLVLPGVGTFAAAMEQLARTGVADAVRERVDGGVPLLAICLGMQLLAATSEESPGRAGIGVIRSAVVRLPPSARVPQLGWMAVSPASPGGMMSTGYAYFANSFCLSSHDGTWSPSHATNGEPFIAALERDAQLACQFHPELSGAWGTSLMRRWIDAC